MDTEQNFTPFRVIRRRNKLISCFSDHFSFKIICKGMPSTRSCQKEKEALWNLNKKGGWEEYKKKTEEVAEQIIEIVEICWIVVIVDIF